MKNKNVEYVNKKYMQIETIEETVGFTLKDILSALVYFLIRQSSEVPENLTETMKQTRKWLNENEIVPARVRIPDWVYYVTERHVFQMYMGKMVHEVPLISQLKSIDLDALWMNICRKIEEDQNL